MCVSCIKVRGVFAYCENLHPPPRQNGTICDNMHWRLPGSGLRKYPRMVDHGAWRAGCVCLRLHGCVPFLAVGASLAPFRRVFTYTGKQRETTALAKKLGPYVY